MSDDTHELAQILVSGELTPSKAVHLKPKIIVSYPERTPGIRKHRSTYQTITELLKSANRSVIIMIYAVSNSARTLVAELVDCASRGVNVTVVLNDHRGNVEKFIGLWPAGCPLPRIMVPNRECWSDGNLHAKTLIVDGKKALVTSANLTGWATDMNLELGVLFEGELALEVQEFIISLINKTVIKDQIS